MTITLGAVCAFTAPRSSAAVHGPRSISVLTLRVLLSVSGARLVAAPQPRPRPGSRSKGELGLLAGGVSGWMGALSIDE